GKVPGRLPAEVVYDAIVSATAGQTETAERRNEPVDKCAIGVGRGYTARNNANGYVLSVFGKPKRETPCDCERSNEPSLLQTVFLRNDQEMFNLITRRNGWFYENMAALDGLKSSAVEITNVKSDDGENKLNQVRYLERVLEDQAKKLKKLQATKDQASVKEEIQELKKSHGLLEVRLKALRLEAEEDRSPQAKSAPVKTTKVAALSPSELV